MSSDTDIEQTNMTMMTISKHFFQYIDYIRDYDAKLVFAKCLWPINLG